jgi:hypothetical protein
LNKVKILGVVKVLLPIAVAVAFFCYSGPGTMAVPR